MKKQFAHFAELLIVLLLAAIVAARAHAATPQTYYFYVFSNPVAGHEDEYNKWYDQRHAADVVSIPGFVSAQRYVKSDTPFFRVVDVQVPQYLIIYKMVTADVEAVFAEVERRLKSGETYMSPAHYDRKTSQNYVYKPLGPELTGPGGEPRSAKPGSKQDYIQLVFAAMVEGKEAEFNVFYNQHHAPEVVAIPRLHPRAANGTRTPDCCIDSAHQIPGPILGAHGRRRCRSESRNPGASSLHHKPRFRQTSHERLHLPRHRPAVGR